MSGEQPPSASPGWGSEEWVDDDKVRTISGQAYEPWKTWDACSGPWKFPAGLMQFLIDAGFRYPTPIQAHCWPVLMDGKDIIGVAKTGSGKTLSFLLPGYIKVKRSEMQDGFECNHAKGPAMIICAPTRELCQQIYEESDRFGRPAEIKTACVYGGASRQPQLRGLQAGPHCVVATPGRLNDFLNDGSIKVGQASYVVLDEADRMLDMGFAPQMKDIIDRLPTVRQVCLFTATWPREVKEIARTLASDPVHIQVGSSDTMTSNADIRQQIVRIRSEGDKMRFLENDIFPKLQQSGASALIFMKTKRGASSLYSSLRNAGAPIVCLHGDMEQRERDQALFNFKQGKAKVLVATDVAQRGLDIKNVQLVINYDPAANAEDYVHRIGRTGRAGEKGDAYTFLYDNDRIPAMNIVTVMRKTGQKIPQELKDIVDGVGVSGGGAGDPELNGSWGRYSAGAAAVPSKGGGGGYSNHGRGGGYGSRDPPRSGGYGSRDPPRSNGGSYGFRDSRADAPRSNGFDRDRREQPDAGDRGSQAHPTLSSNDCPTPC